jgi:SAM-dependent methyltransferase
MLTLDIGCGVLPRGDVNCDLFTKSNIHRAGDCNPNIIPNLIKCPAEKLPFKDKIFDATYSKAMLEHVDNPLVVLREMGRVTRKRIILIVPHRYLRDNWSAFKYAQNSGHKTYFDLGNLTGLIRYAFPDNWFIVYTKKRRAFEHLPIDFPHALYAEIRLDKKNGDTTVMPIGKQFIERLSGLDVIWE